ncbi:MAG: hypothetical protein C0169_00635 [Thermodesulfobacterium geofontis]|uniref:Osmotically-inducible protein Y n=2 Tax=Thermodesulfobacterium geofontis TaxID=1295609 RepID=A0A2N7QGJ0_9BACT|nr:MAG: hypothetical protein C0169_00635 [Thermodesulfobacterium geofontis]
MFLLIFFQNKIKKNQYIFKILSLFIFFCVMALNSGCGWVLVGTGAAVGYKVATDPRSIGTQIDDATITTKVKLKLIEDKEIKAFSIDVDTLNGVVTLTGVVETEAQRIKAIELAKSVPGVKAVVNNLQVKRK